MKTMFLGLVFVIIFSIVLIDNAYGSISFDKGSYTWTDKINIRITEHGMDSSSVKIYTDNHELNNYKLSKTGNGLYTGKIILTGFPHDVNGDGKSDTNPRTMGSGPNNGFLETTHDDEFKVYVRFADGDTISQSVKIRWNLGLIGFDTPQYSLDDFAKLKVIDPDMNLNPDRMDTFTVHVWSESDVGGIDLVMIETDESTGIFEGAVTFTTSDESSGHRLRVIHGDTVQARYVDGMQSVHTTIDDTIISENTKIKKSLSAPLKQKSSGILSEHISCKTGLEKLFRSGDSVVCVKPLTAEKLVQLDVFWR